MASMIRSIFRLFLSKTPSPAVDAEQGNSATDPMSTYPTAGTRATLISTEDSLTLFRLLVGINTAAHLGLTPSPSRPAPNLGIYTRVVHNEQKSKDSYKVFAFVINACFGLQIVVASALTAMGAAGTAHAAITAFGAINTVIAGFLTFLKGSGLPNRLKYFGNEWKKIREFIEQRERDFSREGCTLDVHEVVATIEAMYGQTKANIEMNTPDSYNSINNAGISPKQGAGKDNHDTGGHTGPAENLISKLKSIEAFGEKVQHFAADVEDKVHHGKASLHGRKNDLAKTVEERERELTHNVDDQRLRAEKALSQEEQRVKDEIQKQKEDLSRQAEHGQQRIAATIAEQQNIAAQNIRNRERQALRDITTGIEEHADRAVDQFSSASTAAISGNAQQDNAGTVERNRETTHDRTIA